MIFCVIEIVYVNSMFLCFFAVNCPAGEQPDPTSPDTTCELCMEGFYKENSGGHACDACPTGLNTTSPGTVFDYDCIGKLVVAIRAPPAQPASTPPAPEPSLIMIA